LEPWDPRLKLVENGVLVTYSTSDSAAKVGIHKMQRKSDEKSMDGNCPETATR